MIDHILAFQNHDLVKVQIENIRFFSYLLVVVFGALLFVPFRRNTYSNVLMNFDITNSLRGVAIISIIIGHFNYYVVPDRNLLFFGNLGSYGVPIFLLLSGYALSESYKKNLLINFFDKKFLRVYIPFIIATVVIMTIDSILQQRSIYDLWNYIQIIVGYKTFDRNYWFIHYLFYWYFIFVAVFSISTSNNKKIIFLLCGAILPFIFKSFGGIAQTTSLCFPIGVVISLYKEEINDCLQLFHKKTLFRKIIIFISLMFVMDYFVGASPPDVPLLYNVSVCVHKLIMTLLILLLFIVFFSSRVSAFYHFIGGISYELYLLHGFFMYSYDFILFKYPIYFSFFIYLFFMIIMSLALRIVSGRLGAFIAPTI